MFLAVINNAAMNIQLHIFTWIYVFISLKQIQGVELLNHKVKCVQFYKTLPNCFIKRLYQFGIPTNNALDFSCSITLSTLITVSLYYISYFSGYVLVSHCGFNLLGNVSMKELYFQFVLSYWQKNN